MTPPPAPLLPDCIVTAPTVRPAPVMALAAAACVWPTTFGTAICAGPLETTRLTGEPLATFVPAGGLSLMTLPEATVLLDCIVTAPTVRPAPVMALAAAACVWPTTFGTAICAGPLETTRLTGEPLATFVPAGGLSLMTLPAATVLLDCIVTAPTVRPAPVMALAAAACVWPTTFGTAICAGPLETTRLTGEPLATFVPAGGLSLMTLPEATVLLDCIVTAPTVRPAPVRALAAAACVWPTTFGTAICAGPLETTRLTGEPLATFVPAGGLSLMTLPAATVLLDCIVTAPTVRPAPVMALVAAACVWPTTFGTAICAGPLETTRLTGEPLATFVPAGGLSLMTLPAATVLLDCIVTAPTVRPAPVMALAAAACVWPTTFGTATLGPGEDGSCTSAWVAPRTTRE